MAILISTINAADQIAGLFWVGQICAAIAMERLAALGFYEIDIDENDSKRVTARLAGVRYCLGRF